MKKNENGRREKERRRKIQWSVAQAERLSYNHEFQNDVQLIRERWKITENITDDIVHSLQWSENLYNKGLSDKLKADVINTFISSNKYHQFGINSESVGMLVGYIQGGSLNMLDTIFPHINKITDKTTGQKVYCMTFYEHTTVDDVTLVFSGYKKTQMQKTKNWQLSERPKTIARKANKLKESMTWKEVADKINDEFNQLFTAETMRKYVDRHRGYI